MKIKGSSALVTGASRGLALRELWWTHDRRRRIARLGKTDRRHPLDEGYVTDAMARQIEEIRNLPEAAG